MGEVADHWYVSSESVHMLTYSAPPGARFGSTDDVRTVFDADQLYYVLQGELVLADPQTGEVRLVRPGEAAFVRAGTWTHGFAAGADRLRVLELVSPGLESPAAVAYTRAQPPLEHALYERPGARGRWPEGRSAFEATAKIRVLREESVLWRMDGEERAVAGAWVATERATISMFELRPGQRTDAIDARGESCMFVLEGRLGFRVPDAARETWFELEVEDGMHVPAATRYQFQSLEATPARFVVLEAH